MLLVMDKIICLGKNYSDHVAEMKEDSPEFPVLFLKPPSVLKEIKNQGTIALPWHRGLIHHECEVVFKLYKKNIIGLGLGLDLTLRDTQKELKQKGHPWEISKVFKNSAIVTPIQGVRDFLNWQETPFSLKVNGELRQQSKLSNAILKPNEIIHYIDKYFPIQDGDLIFTGTPSGVGPLNPGDTIEMNYGPIEYTFQLVKENEF
jgi:2-keto-4-pentenoate hydratase/2-oxohepta-3-ene-1,7-dioic acid hydratase in catechol pathway